MRALYAVREHLGVAHLRFACQKWQGRIRLQERVESIKKKCNRISGEIFLVLELHLRTKSEDKRH